MKIFEYIAPDCYLFSWENKGGLLTKKEANHMAIDLFANGLINLTDFPL